MSKTTLTDEEFEEMFCRMMADSPKIPFPEDFEDSPEKVKVPYVFKKWYTLICCEGSAKERALLYISSHGLNGYRAISNPIIPVYFGSSLTEKEINDFESYIDNHKMKAIAAILYGFEIDEQLYTIDLPHIGDCVMRIQYDTGEDNFTLGDKVNIPWRLRDLFLYIDQFPMNVIEERLPEYKQFAVAV